jgi:hypothetical protein
MRETACKFRVRVNAVGQNNIEINPVFRGMPGLFGLFEGAQLKVAQAVKCRAFRCGLGKDWVSTKGKLC